MSANVKRNIFIGIKVQTETANKLKYIAVREGKPLSTFIYDLLTLYIDYYFKIAKIDWEQLSFSDKLLLP